MSTPKRHPLAVAVAVALGLGTSQVVSAAEITVTNTDDSGAGSLRWAIGQANGSGDPGNTITFDAAVTGTITLASSIFVEPNSLTIQGPGPDVLTVEQDGQVMRLSHNTASVVISGLTLRHTAGSTSAAAPLFSHAPSLSIDNVHFRGESPAVTNGGYGGGCLASSQWTTQPGQVRDLNITNSQFDNCRADSSVPGGAIYARQVGSSGNGGDLRVTIDNTVFQNGFAGGGGAAYIRQEAFDSVSEASHAVTINDVFASNIESYGGYGVLAILQDRDSSLDVDGLSMGANSGFRTLEYRAGANSTASIRNAYFDSNEASGGAIASVDVRGGNTDFELVNGQIFGTAGDTWRGLEIYASDGNLNTVSIRDSLFHGNTFGNVGLFAYVDDGGYGGDTLEIVNTTLTDNETGQATLAVLPSHSTVDAELRHVTVADNTLGGAVRTASERGISIQPGMVSLNVGSEPRIINSVIHGVLSETAPEGLIGTSDFDLTGVGAITVDHSLIGAVDGANITINDANPGSSFIDDGTDPQLLALADNGGLSQTRAFTTDSPVFDAGNPAADLPAFDQRGDGFARVSGSAPDMGAFELQTAPAVSLDTESLAFPDTRVETTSAPLGVELTNSGTSDLDVTEVSVSGDLVFAPDGSDCTGAAIPPGGSCSIAVAFTPGSRADFTGSLDIATNADPANDSVALSGTGVAPIIDVGPDHDFGTVLVDTISDPQSITIANTGDDALEVTGFDPQVEAPFALDFSDCGAGLPFSVAAGTSCELSTTFEPTTTGNAGTTVTVQSDSLSSDTNQFSLAGQGVIGQLAVSPSGDVDFGEVGPGDSGQVELTLSNEGSAPVTVEGWTNLPEPFSISGDCPEPPFSLDPGASCTLIITFSPESAGDYEESLVLGFDDGSGSASTQVAVSGRGTAPAAPATPIPALDRIGLILGSGLLALMGLLGLRRRRESGRLAD